MVKFSKPRKSIDVRSFHQRASFQIYLVSVGTCTSDKTVPRTIESRGYRISGRGKAEITAHSLVTQEILSGIRSGLS